MLKRLWSAIVSVFPGLGKTEHPETWAEYWNGLRHPK